MTARWIMVAVAGAALGVALPADALAQGNSAAARGRQQARPQPAAAAQSAAARDRDRTQHAARDRAQAELERARERQRTEERLRTERERQRAEDRLRLERERQRAWERQREAERRREWERQRGYGYDPRPGPAFCRDGSGHPVKGRQWCRDKGFELGSSRSVWERARWEDIILRQPRRRDDGRLGRGVLGDILGERTLGRLASYGYENYGRGDLSGRWYDDADGAILELAVGGVPFARLVDANRNGRVNTVLFRR